MVLSALRPTVSSGVCMATSGIRNSVGSERVIPTGSSVPGSCATGAGTACAEIGGGDVGSTIFIAKYTEPSRPKTIRNDVCSERLTPDVVFSLFTLWRFLGARLSVISSRVRDPSRMISLVVFCFLERAFVTALVAGFLAFTFFLELESGSLDTCRFTELF